MPDVDSHDAPGPSDPRAYGRAFGDVYDEWYGDLSDPAELVAAIGELTPAGSRILELGAGTGRLAMPLQAAGFTVVALDAATSMLRQMRPGPLPLTADMAVISLTDHTIDGAFIAYNTFFNLDTADYQARCAAELHRVIRPGGFVAIEAFIPGDAPGATSWDVAPARQSPERAVWIATRREPDTGVLEGAHLDFGAHGLRIRPWRIRYLTPSQLDAVMANAGFHLTQRSAGWTGVPHEADDPRHISIYRH